MSTATPLPQGSPVQTTRKIGEDIAVLAQVDSQYEEMSRQFESFDPTKVSAGKNPEPCGTIIVLDIFATEIRECFRCQLGPDGAPINMTSHELVDLVLDTPPPGVDRIRLLIHCYTLAWR